MIQLGKYYTLVIARKAFVATVTTGSFSTFFSFLIFSSSFSFLRQLYWHIIKGRNCHPRNYCWYPATMVSSPPRLFGPSARQPSFYSYFISASPYCFSTQRRSVSPSCSPGGRSETCRCCSRRARRQSRVPASLGTGGGL